MFHLNKHWLREQKKVKKHNTSRHGNYNYKTSSSDTNSTISPCFRPNNQLLGGLGHILNSAIIELKKGNYSKAFFLFTIASLTVTAIAQSVSDNKENDKNEFGEASILTSNDSNISHCENISERNATSILLESPSRFFSYHQSYAEASVNQDNDQASSISDLKLSDGNIKKSFAISSVTSNKKLNKMVSNLVSKLPILYVPNEDRSPLGITEEYYVKVYEELRGKIRRVLPLVFNNQVLIPILKNPDFEIYIRSPLKMKALGSFNYVSNCISLLWDPGITDNQLISILQNEFHHAAICQKMQSKTGNNEECVVIPQTKKMEKLYKKGVDEIEKYSQLFKKYIETRSEDLLLKEFLDAVESYEPYQYPLFLSINEHEKVMKNPGVKELSDGRIFLPKGSVIGPAKYHVDLYIESIQYYGRNGRTVRYSLSFAKDNSTTQKALAFFNAFEVRKGIYDKVYAKEELYQSDTKYQLADKLSDIEMLSPSLQKFFFPDICVEFSKFHEVEDYCSRPGI